MAQERFVVLTEGRMPGTSGALLSLAGVSGFQLAAFPRLEEALEFCEELVTRERLRFVMPTGPVRVLDLQLMQVVHEVDAKGISGA